MKPILIVEDEAIMRESLRDWFADSGYVVETAEAGEKALQTIAEHDFGVVILDMRLPGKNGIEVLKEARAKRPELKGIIITAYPSVQTAVEAMKQGAIEYLPKPFEMNNLEKIVRETLGPVQAEIRPRSAATEVALPAIKETEVSELITISPEDIPTHLRLGKIHFEARRYQKAREEFENILKTDSGHIEARIWLRKIRTALEAPEVVTETATEESVTATEVKARYCVWMKLGLVDFRICTNNSECLACEFDQQMQEKLTTSGTPEIDKTLERFKELPGNQRFCRYALKGDVSYRPCTHLFRCVTCEFAQTMDDALQQKLAKLAARREVLRKQTQAAKA